MNCAVSTDASPIEKVSAQMLRNVGLPSSLSCLEPSDIPDRIDRSGIHVLDQIFGSRTSNCNVQGVECILKYPR